VKAAALCDVIAKTKIMWAEQVVKKQTGEEVWQLKNSEAIML
jgi:hypothetical protein